MILTLAEVRAALTAAHPTARYNPPFIDGILWTAFCDIPGCRCFIPSGSVCDEFCDPEDAVFGLRCACCGWPEHRHDQAAPNARRAIADVLRCLDPYDPEDDTLPVQVGDPDGVPLWRTVDRLAAELYELATRGGAS